MRARSSKAPLPDASADPDESKVAGTRKRRSFKRLHSATKARRDDVYSLAEIQKLYGVEEQTAYNWIKEGLKRVPDTSRFLVRGGELNFFHAVRNENAKRPLGLEQLFCFGCHEPREPAPGSLIGADPNVRAIRIEGRCPICGTAMFRPWSRPVCEALRAAQTEPSGKAPGPPAARSGAAVSSGNPQRPDTECDSASPTDSAAAKESPQTSEWGSPTNGQDQLPLPFEFFDQRRNDR